jgi:hypothetical protein
VREPTPAHVDRTRDDPELAARRRFRTGQRRRPTPGNQRQHDGADEADEHGQHEEPPPAEPDLHASMSHAAASLAPQHDGRPGSHRGASDRRRSSRAAPPVREQHAEQETRGSATVRVVGRGPRHARDDAERMPMTIEARRLSSPAMRRCGNLTLVN